MSSALQAKMNRLDALLDRKLADREAEQARADADLKAARRQRQRANAEARKEIAARYNSAYQSFGTRYRARLFNRLARKLAPGHELADIRADNVSSQPVVFDNFEKLLLTAAVAEGLRPSAENLPDSGELMRVRTDENTGEFFSKESFIKSMGREGRRVLRFVDPATSSVLWGAPFSRAE